MMTPLERAARALCRRRMAGMETNWHLFLDDARAVLTAIRPPSSAMVRAGAEVMSWSNGEGASIFDIRPGFEAMIDAAMEEG